MKTTTNNPAQLGLTDPENTVLGIIRDRVDAGLTVMTSDICKSWGDKNRGYVCRVIASLIEKGLVTRYSRNYYSITTT